LPISPIPVGQTHVVLQLTWQDDSGVAVDLTGAAVTARIKPINGTGSAATGTLVVTNAATGNLTYKWATAEVATVGEYEIQFKAVYGDGTILLCDPIYLDVMAAI